MIGVVINGDDFGLSDGVCRSILQLLESGAISNTTVMAAADGVAERCRRYGASSIADRAGVHLQLTGGRPISPAREVPSLIDKRSGRFLDKSNLPLMSPDEVELEWTRQIEYVSTLLGRLPSHMDTHHGAHRVPVLTPVYFRLARKFSLPVRGGIYVNQFASQAQGVLASTLVLNQWTGKGLSAQNLKTLITSGQQHLGTSGILEIVSHPGFNDPKLELISSLNKARENDHAVLMQLSDDAWLASQDLPLVRFPSLDVPDC
jgi:predicted glycoside hydrolase/deacetylase ChbG (UPF0249 family)